MGCYGPGASHNGTRHASMTTRNNNGFIHVWSLIFKIRTVCDWWWRRSFSRLLSSSTTVVVHACNNSGRVYSERRTAKHFDLIKRFTISYPLWILNSLIYSDGTIGTSARHCQMANGIAIFMTELYFEEYGMPEGRWRFHTEET